MSHKDIEQLEQKLRQVEHAEDKPASNIMNVHGDQDSRAGARAGVELVGAVVAGTAIGIGLDHWLGTNPLFLLVFFFLGMGTGFYNVYRVTNNMGTTVGYSRLQKQKKDARTARKERNVNVKE